MNYPPRPASWSVLLALALVYLTWGTTYLAIRIGVQQFPPALFGGSRICLAGIILLLYQVVRGQPLRLPRRELLGSALVGLFLFVGGNWPVSISLHLPGMESGAVAVLVATTPLWMALLETIWPWGERLTWRGWLGIGAGLMGMVLMSYRVPSLNGPLDVPLTGSLLTLCSAFSWAVGSFIVRYQGRTGPLLAAAAYQMAVGGGALLVLGLILGDAEQLTPERFTPAAVGAFFYLLVFGSLVGFLAYVWLLDHVSAALAGTYAYVNPMVALLVGWLLAGEQLTWPVLGAMSIILASVALVRSGGVRQRAHVPKDTHRIAEEKGKDAAVSLPILGDDGG
jgi:drug/metabolite transporter (DMT)-like permease